MGKKGGSAPKPPDPIATYGAQQSANIGSAVANQFLGNVNQRTPYGNLSYNQTGTMKWTDPLSGKVYDLPQFTATQTLSPKQQQLQNWQTLGETNLAKLGANQAGRLGSILGKPMNFGGAPKVSQPQLQRLGANATPNLRTSLPSGGKIQSYLGNVGKVDRSVDDAGKIRRGIAFAGDIKQGFGDAGQMQRFIGGQAGAIRSNVGDAGAIDRQVDNAGAIQRQFGDAGNITRTYGTDFSKDRQRVEDALMARLNPSLEQERDRLSTQLANQGIKQGTEAYDRAMQNFGKQSNDARLGSILGAGEEQTRLANLEAQRAGFQNAAQQQAFGQAQTRGMFANDAQAQQFGQNATAMQLANAAQQQQHGQNMDRTGFWNDAQNQRFGQDLARGQFQNQTQQQAYDQMLGRAQFANQGQAQQYGQNANNAQFANAAQAQQYGQNLSDAQFGNQAQQQAFGQNLARGQFQNAAQDQRFGQGVTSATFGNDARQQGFANQMAALGFNNNLAQQQFGNQRGLRSDYLNEQYAMRNQPINEIAALLGTGQVQNPNFIPTQGGGVANTDYASLVQNNYGNQLKQWQEQQASRQGLMGGLFGLGTNMIMASDRRLKRNIVPLGEVDGLTLYRFAYIDGPDEHVGFMADEVAEKYPGAVREMPNGFLAVDYGAFV